jgi:hypothetical protein
MLAGASYLDMVWYGIPNGSVHRHFLFMVHLLDKAIPDKEIFDFGPDTDLEQLAGKWEHKMKKAKVFPLMKGTLLAGDGLVCRIKKTLGRDRENLEEVAFKNRKGYYGFIVQAFCDAYCKFRVFGIGWPGATPDITAYKQTDLYRF